MYIWTLSCFAVATSNAAAATACRRRNGIPLEFITPSPVVSPSPCPAQPSRAFSHSQPSRSQSANGTDRTIEYNVWGIFLRVCVRNGFTSRSFCFLRLLCAIKFSGVITHAQKKIHVHRSEREMYGTVACQVYGSVSSSQILQTKCWLIIQST